MSRKKEPAEGGSELGLQSRLGVSRKKAATLFAAAAAFSPIAAPMAAIPIP